MSTNEPRNTLVIVGQRLFEVSAIERPNPSIALRVTMNGSERWTYDGFGWRWSCGVSGELFYLWTARRLVWFAESCIEPSELSLDEDLSFAFRVGSGWLLVCETSVRLVDGQRQLARIECDVIEAAQWEEGHLIVADQLGMVLTIAVEGEALVVTEAVIPQLRHGVPVSWSTVHGSMADSDTTH